MRYTQLLCEGEQVEPFRTIADQKNFPLLSGGEFGSGAQQYRKVLLRLKPPYRTEQDNLRSDSQLFPTISAKHSTASKQIVDPIGNHGDLFLANPFVFTSVLYDLGAVKNDLVS